MNPDSDLCRINGEYVFYGVYDEPDYIEELITHDREIQTTLNIAVCYVQIFMIDNRILKIMRSNNKVTPEIAESMLYCKSRGVTYGIQG